MNFEKQYVWMISEKLDGQKVINIPFADMWSKVIIVSTIMDGNSHRYLSKEEEKRVKLPLVPFLIIILYRPISLMGLYGRMTGRNSHQTTYKK